MLKSNKECVMKISSIQGNKSFKGHNKQIEKEVLNSLGNGVKALSKYKNLMGEKQDIILNAIGTGIVAPIVINNNPLLKAEKETKQYSAIRQTAMAIISVATQVGLVLPIDKYVDKTIKEGKLGEKFTSQHPENIQALKRVLPLGVALITIPLSCWVLNKTYPPFMKKFFPKIANSQKTKEIKTEIYNPNINDFEKKLKLCKK